MVLETKCESTRVRDGVDGYLGGHFHVAAIHEVIDACWARDVRRSDELAAEAFGTGDEKRVYDELLAEAMAALNRTALSIDLHLNPGNTVEATFILRILQNYAGEFASLEGAASWWERYESGTERTELLLDGVYVNVLVAQSTAETIETMLELYPWDAKPCMPPELGDSLADTAARFERARIAADAYVEQHPDYYGAARSDLVRNLVPKFELYQERGWWPGLLASIEASKAAVSYWENVTRPVSELPSFDEAILYLAEYRNTTHTMQTDWVLSEFRWALEGNKTRARNEWTTDPDLGPARFVAALEWDWPFRDLKC